MAYIYRYELRDAELRENTDLREYVERMEHILDEYYGGNLKDIIIESRYFEIKLYIAVSRGTLQAMGRRLKKRVFDDVENHGFIRMEQVLYALVYPPEDDAAETHVEFIDSMLLDNHDLFMERASNFFERTEGRRALLERGYSDLYIEAVIKNYYVDVQEAYIDRSEKTIFPESTEGIRCFCIKGYHRHIESEKDLARRQGEIQAGSMMVQLETCFDYGTVRGRGLNPEQEQSGFNPLDYQVIKIESERPDLVERVENELKLYISSAETIGDLDETDRKEEYKNRKLIFTVHNTGQALATSLAFEKEMPFLYFDYGMPYWRNLHTKPPVVTMPVRPGCNIILSHIHKDHWFRIADDPNAYSCRWFIPDQTRGRQLNHKLSEIIVQGGSVHTIDRNMSLFCGEIICAAASSVNPTRVGKHPHETGCSMCIRGEDEAGETISIFVAGDQDYDYIDRGKLRELDILVATHHGGKYCWSAKGFFPNGGSSRFSKVIYSYGVKNTHKHPSKEAEYKATGWREDYHTYKGDWSIELFV